MSKFLKLINTVITEQGIDFPEKTDDGAEPISMDSEIPSALPEPNDVALDIVKYKTLLKALREALYNSAKDNIEKQREISNVDVDVDDAEKLKQVENQLMSFLDQSETVPETQE
jgi:hypothetical protein